MALLYALMQSGLRRERKTTYFHNLEKRNYNIKHIQKLILEGDTIISSPGKIKQRQYYHSHQGVPRKEITQQLYFNKSISTSFDICTIYVYKYFILIKIDSDIGMNIIYHEPRSHTPKKGKGLVMTLNIDL